MTIWPSVVIGLGSTGACVLANMERLLYEVLGDASVDLFRLMVIETAQTAKDDDRPPGGIQSRLVFAHEPDVGQAIKNLSQILKEEFDWCPKDLKISGQGAGNIRAGGRLMFFSKFTGIRQAIADAMNETHEAAGRPSAIQGLQDQFGRRGLTPPANLINAHEQAVYVVGTLAGGTCSGMCVDLGYLIHEANPAAKRIGVFFIPDKTAAPTFQQNTWAALRDLEYFCDNTDAFSAVWPNNRQAHSYSGDGAKPYDQVYLLSPLNQRKQSRLEYRTSPDAPLVVMAASQLAADLLGLASIRSEKLVNINQHVGGAEKRRMFLNFNLRAISYPKYEISEAAASKVVSETVCAAWLDESKYVSEGAVSSPIKKDDVHGEGRHVWNERFPGVWMGARSSIDIDTWVDRVLAGNVDQPSQTLVHQFASDNPDTFYSKIAQNLPNRFAELKTLVNQGMAAVAGRTANLKCMELFLEGVRDHVQNTLNFWRELGTPDNRDDSAWLSVTRNLVRRILDEKGSPTSATLGATKNVLRDGLEEIVTRLQMYLLREALAGLVAWIETDRLPWVHRLRDNLQRVAALSAQRHKQLLSRLQDESGPILKLPRSKRDTFEQEINSLAQEGKAFIRGPYLRYANGEFEGHFIARGDRADDHSAKIFLLLRGPIQERFLNTLSKTMVDIVEQIIGQQRLPQTEIHWVNTHELSLATETSLDRASSTVPSYIAAKDANTSQRLEQELRRVIPDFPLIENKSLPMFDHMAVFYQEGAGFEPNGLHTAEAFRLQYETQMKLRPDYLDPLRLMKKPKTAAGEA